MAAPTVQDILDNSAVLLNDSAKTQYTYAVQLPLYNIAQRDLEKKMELNNVPITNEVSTTIVVPAGALVTSFTSIAPNQLPSDLVEIQQLLERQNGVTEDYIPMTRREYLPGIVEITESLLWWNWINQEIRYIGATTDRQIQLNYIANRLPKVTTTTTTISLINAQSFLEFRTAALCAEFIGENKTRADSLNADATLALDDFLGINTKGRQAIATRRRPFMAAYKSRGNGY